MFDQVEGGGRGGGVRGVVYLFDICSKVELSLMSFCSASDARIQRLGVSQGLEWMFRMPSDAESVI